MNNNIALYSLRFVILIVAQALIFNNINFLGYINPYIYIIFIIIFPIKNDRITILITSFLLGLALDVFMDSGGINAAASVFLAYVRPLFLKFSFGTLYQHQTIKFSNVDIKNLIIYIALCTLFHHLILFWLEVFNISQILLIIKKVVFSSIFTIVLSTIFILLFKTRK